MRKFKEHKVAYNAVADEASAKLGDSIVDYLYDNFDFIVSSDEASSYYDRSDEVIIYPDSIHCYSIIDGDLEVACFSADDSKYVMMTSSNKDFYYTGSTIEEFEEDFQNVLNFYKDYAASKMHPLDESCIKKLNEFKMSLAAFDIGEDFIEACEKQNIKDFKGIASILKQVFDNRKKQ